MSAKPGIKPGDQLCPRELEILRMRCKGFTLVETRTTLRAAENLEAKGNHHPTVQPTELMRYLCRLVTPPGGVVLDPFMGSGSTLKAAELEGFSAIGIELDPAYIEIAKRRIAADMPLFAEVEA